MYGMNVWKTWYDKLPAAEKPLIRRLVVLRNIEPSLNFYCSQFQPEWGGSSC